MAPLALSYSLLAASGVVLAAPYHAASPPSTALVRRDMPAVDDPVWCDNPDLSDPDVTSMIWNDWRVGVNLDGMASSFNSEDWVAQMADIVIKGQGSTQAYGCGYTDQGCLQDDAFDCAALQAAGTPAFYYIFLAVKQMQGFFKAAQDALTDNALTGILSISELQSDFAVNITGFDGLPDWVATAMDIGSSLAGAIPEAGGIAVDIGNTFVQSALEGAANADDYESADPSDKLYEALKSYLTSYRQVFDDTLLTAVGGGGDPSTLPGQGNCPDDQPCQSPIAGFMSDGRFLLQGEDLDKLTESSWPVLQRKLVDVALSASGYVVIVCSEHTWDLVCKNYPGWQMIQTDVGDRVASLAAPDEGGHHSPAPDQVGLVQDKYGINLYEYFQGSWDCWRAGSPGIDTANLPGDGSTPQCFYNGTILAGDIFALPS